MATNPNVAGRGSAFPAAGTSHSDWQVIGSAEYAPNRWLNLQLGYRSLNFNYQASGRDLGFNVHMKGPIIAATFRF